MSIKFVEGKLLNLQDTVYQFLTLPLMKNIMLFAQKVGVFDVSHMGEFSISGPGALDFLQKMTTNDLSILSPGQAQYSILCNENGGIVDDLIIYKKQNEFLLVVNASNSIKNLKWLNEYADEDVLIKDISDFVGLLAIQGPESRKLLRQNFRY